MRWTKRGLVFPPSAASWASSHAALPVVEPRGRVVRVYFSGRDDRGRSRIGWFEFDPARPGEILRVSAAPVLDLGPLGAYDDSGVTSASLVRVEGRWHQYFTGWSLGVTVPFYFGVGLATSEDGEEFTRVSPAPVLGRTAVDPYLAASPFVRVEDGVWRMWYVSAVRWEATADRPRHLYHIRYAESRDGVEWRPTGRVCIDFRSPDEYAIARPCVLRDGDRYRMWYSYRGAAYRIGYAESTDGLDWRRMDERAGIAPSATGWDSEMVEYPFVFDHEGSRYMLYNGNGYGRTGIGMAVLEQD